MAVYGSELRRWSNFVHKMPKFEKLSISLYYVWPLRVAMMHLDRRGLRVQNWKNG